MPGATEVDIYFDACIAIYLAAALEGGCGEFWTNDRRLEKVAASRIALVPFA